MKLKVGQTLRYFDSPSTIVGFTEDDWVLLSIDGFSGHNGYGPTVIDDFGRKIEVDKNTRNKYFVPMKEIEDLVSIELENIDSQSKTLINKGITRI